MKNLKDAGPLEMLRDDFRLYSTGSDDDLALDIQDAIAREMCFSMAVDNIQVMVEDEIVTLQGEVFNEE